MNMMDMGVSDAPDAMKEKRIGTAIVYGTPDVSYTGFVTEYDARIDVHYVESTDALTESLESYGGAKTSQAPYEGWYLKQDIGTEEMFTRNIEINYILHEDAGDDAVYGSCCGVNEYNGAVKEPEDEFNDYESTEDILDQALEGGEFPLPPWRRGVNQIVWPGEALNRTIEFTERIAGHP